MVWQCKCCFFRGNTILFISSRYHEKLTCSYLSDSNIIIILSDWYFNIFSLSPKLRFVTYILGLFSLLIYESPFTLLILLPLFLSERKQKKVWITHLAVIIGIILLTYFIRIYFGEGRVLTMDGGLLLIAKVMASVVMGPVISLGLFLYGPARTVLHMNYELFMVMLISFPIFAAGLLYVNKVRKGEIEPKNAHVIKELHIKSVSLQIPEWIWNWLKSIAIIFIWLMSAYLLSFTHFPPVARYGRGTSVHAAATLPASLLATLIIWGIWKLLAKHKIYRIGYVLILALYFSVTLGNRYSIQQDFVQSWSFQKQYWNEIIDLVPDAKDGTIIFVVDHNLPKVHYIESTTWTDYFILSELIEFPADWNRQPMVLTIDGNWESDLKIKDEKITYPWNIFWDFTIDPDNVILITDTNDGNLVRIDQTAIQTLSGIYIEPMINHQTIPLEDQYATRNLFTVMDIEGK